MRQKAHFAAPRLRAQLGNRRADLASALVRKGIAHTRGLATHPWALGARQGGLTRPAPPADAASPTGGRARESGYNRGYRAKRPGETDLTA